MTEDSTSPITFMKPKPTITCVMCAYKRASQNLYTYLMTCTCTEFLNFGRPKFKGLSSLSSGRWGFSDDKFQHRFTNFWCPNSFIVVLTTNDTFPTIIPVAIYKCIQLTNTVILKFRSPQLISALYFCLVQTHLDHMIT